MGEDRRGGVSAGELSTESAFRAGRDLLRSFGGHRRLARVGELGRGTELNSHETRIKPEVRRIVSGVHFLG